MTTKIFALLVFVRSMFCGCLPDSQPGDFERNKRVYKIDKTGNLPKILKESSGLAKTAHEDHFWTHQDSGGSRSIFLIDSKGNIIDTLQLPGIPNVDWEDIAEDNKGNLYIGDFGNNLNRRQDLRIYKLHVKTGKVDTISFSYADQTAFPPSKEQRNFDAEALVWHQDKLHIFSKNRGNKCVKHYVLSDQPGNYEAVVVEEKYLSGMVTAADIDPEFGLLALLSYGRIYLFKLNDEEHLMSQPYKCIRFARSGQSEGLTFYEEGNMLISNESGKLFKIQKRQ